MAITRSEFLKRRRNFFEREEDDEEEELRPSRKASFEQKRKQFFEAEKKKIKEPERAEQPKPEPPQKPSVGERVKEFISGVFKRKEEPEEELPEFEVAEPSAFESFTLDDADDEYIKYPSFFNSGDNLANFSQADVDTGVIIDAGDKFIDPKRIEESNHPYDRFAVATKDFLEGHPRAKEVIQNSLQVYEDIVKKTPILQGYHKATGKMIYGSSELATQYYDKVLPETVEYENETMETVGAVIANVINYAAATEIAGLAGLGKLALPAVFNTFAQTSAPIGTTGKQRMLKVPVATVEGYLFNLFPSLRGLRGKKLIIQSLKGIGLSGGTGGTASYINAMIEGKSQEDALEIAKSAALTYSLFYVFGQAVGILGDEITKSKIIGGKNKRFTPDEMREVVRNSGYEKTEPAKQLMQIADDADRAGKNIEIDWAAAKKSWIQRILGDKRTVGAFQHTLVEPEAKIGVGKKPVEPKVPKEIVLKAPEPKIELLGAETAVFRGAKKHIVDMKRENGITGGVSFSEDKTVAERFAKKTEGTVKEYKISPEAVVVNHSELEGMDKEEISTYLKENEIDVIRFDVPEGAKGEAELRVVNKAVLQEVAEKPLVKPPVEKPKAPAKKLDFVELDKADFKALATTKTPADLSGVVGDVQEAVGNAQTPLENKLSELKNNLSGVRGRSKEATAERKKLRVQISETQEKLDKIQSDFEEKSMDFQIKLAVEAMKQAKVKGLDLGKIGDGMENISEGWQEFRDEFLQRIQERPYIEQNFQTPIGEIIDRMVVERGVKVKPTKPPVKKPKVIKPKLNWKQLDKEEYTFCTDCTATGVGEKIEEMVDQSEDITYDKFVEVVGEDKLKEMFSQYAWEGEKGELTLKDDAAVTYYRSVYDGKPAYFLVHSATEYVFTGESEIKPVKPVPTKPPEPTRKPKKKKKAKPPKKKAKKPKTTITGGKIKQIPSVKIEKIWGTVKARRPQLPILENVRIKDGQVLMTDLEISVAINTNLKDGMYKVVGKDLVTLDPKLKLEADFPVIPDPKNVVAQSLPENLVGVIKQATYHAGKDETRPVLTGIKFEFTKNKVRLVTTDGFRLFNRSVGIRGQKKATFITGATTKLNRILNDVLKNGGVVDIGFDKKNSLISFKNKNGRIVVRGVEGNFPEYKMIYPQTNRRIIIDKKAFKEAVKDISAYAKQTANIATIEIQEAKVLLKAKDKEGTEKVVELPIKRRDDKKIDGVVEGMMIMPIKTDGAHIQLNYRFISDALLALTDDDIYLSYFVDKEGKIDTQTPVPLSDKSESPIEKTKRIAGITIVGKLNAEIIKSGDKYFVRDEDTGRRQSTPYSSEKAARAFGDGLTDDKNYKEWVFAQVEKKQKYFYLSDNKGKEIARSDNRESLEAYRDGMRTRAGLKTEKKKRVSSRTQASMDRFSDIKNVAASMSYHKAIEFPEILRMVRELTGEIPQVSYPRYRPTLGGRPLGLFVGTEEGKIILNPDLFESPEQAVKTFAHEVGHLADWLPAKTLKRGNLIGHIASLTRFLRHTFAGVANEARIDALKDEEVFAKGTRKAEIEKEIKKLRKNPEFTLEEVKVELRKLTQMWKPFNEEAMIEEGREGYIKYRYSSAEIYADAVSVLFNDPTLLKENAPIFYKAFFNALDRKPKIKKVYFDTMDLLEKGREAVLGQREKDIRAMFQKGEDLNRVKLEEAKVRKYNFAVRLKTQIANENQAMIEVVKKLKKKGKEFADEENPLYWLEEKNYIGGKVKAWVETNIQPIYEDIQRSDVTWEDFAEVLFLERVINERGGTRNPIKLLRQMDEGVVEGGFSDFIKSNKKKLPKEVQGVSVEKLLDRIQKKSSDEQLKWLKVVFGEYLTNPLDPESGSMYDELIGRLPMGIANPLGLDVESAREQLEFLKGKLGNRYAVVERNLPKFRTAIKSVLPEALEAELYKEKLVKQMIANEGYATFQVLDYLNTYIPASVKRQVGTLKEIANPATSTVQKTISVIRAIERNKTKLALVKTLKEAGEIQEAKTLWTGKAHIPLAPRKRDLALVTLMEKGKYKGYYVDPYIAQSFRRISTGQSNAILQTISFFNSKLWRPLFVVYSLRFQTKNLWRDFMRTYKNTPNLSLVKALKIYVKALPSSVKRNIGWSDKTITEMENAKIFSGATYGDLMRGGGIDDMQIERVIEKVGLSPLRQKKRNFFLKTFMFLPNLISGIGNTIETLPKVAAYQDLQGKMPPKELASFIRNYVGSPDFLKRGTATPLTNNILLFSNPMIQGLSADFHIATDPKTRMGWMWKTFMTTILPKLLMYAAELGLFGLGLKTLMNKASEYDKTNYNIIPLGEDENKKAIYLRIPQDETGRTIGGFVWKALGTVEDGKFTLTDVAQLFSYLGGDIPSVTPTISHLVSASQFVSGRNPYDAYRGRYVIPQQEFEAGGKYALKPFLAWLWRQSGGNIFFSFGATYQAPETNTWLQEKYEIPVVGEILESWIKTSDYGQVQKNREIVDEVRKLRSIELLEQETTIDKYIEKYQKGEGEKLELTKQLVKEILGTNNPRSKQDKTTKTNVTKKFQIGILKGEADPNMNSLISSSTNAQKLELLKVLKRTLSKEEYNDLIKVAKDNKVISKDLYKKARKL